MHDRIAVLVSGGGTNLQALLDDPEIRRAIVLVVSDRAGVKALDRAATAGIETAVVEARGDRDQLTGAVADLLASRNVDAVVSAGYMRILGPALTHRFADRWLNVHPALLPAFPGMHGVRDALAYGAKVTGVTVHFVDEGTDTGPVVLQEAIEIRDDDDWDSLEARVHEVEHRLLPRAVRALLRGDLVRRGRHVTIEGTAS